jgi:UDP-2-acetamido-2-deoxy-ribo-hexuluronate aminotransferase
VSAWAQYTLRVPKRDEFQKRLTELGVPSSIHYPIIMPDQPAYKTLAGDTSYLVESRKAAQEVISIPIYPDMSDEIMNAIIEKVNKAV